MKKIWLLCLCLASVGLVGCFHVPDEDWLPSRNKTETWSIQKDEEMEQALNSFMDWITMISSEWDKINNGVIETGEIKEVSLDAKDEIINDEEMVENEESIDDKVDAEQIGETIISEE